MFKRTAPFSSSVETTSGLRASLAIDPPCHRPNPSPAGPYTSFEATSSDLSVPGFARSRARAGTLLAYRRGPTERRHRGSPHRRRGDDRSIDCERAPEDAYSHGDSGGRGSDAL